MSGFDLGLSAGGAEQRSIACEDASTLTYSVMGQGPAVVFVNAHGQDLLVFSRLAALLAPRRRVIAWKPRGTFEPGSAPYTLFDQVRDLERIVRHEQLAELSLITWCAGAKVAIEFARRERAVRSLVLTNGTFTRLPGFERLETEFEQTLQQLCKTVVQKPALASMMMSAMRSLLGGASAQVTDGSAGTYDPALKALIAEPFQSEASTLRYAGQVVDYLAHDISPALRELAVPTLVVSGRNDKVSSPDMARAVARMLPLGRYEEIPTGSHYCLYELPAEAATRIEGFLAHPHGTSRAVHDSTEGPPA
jgi:pimeloyl-ACP methyl ester carboxylesterase